MITNQNQSFVPENSQGFNLKKTLALYTKKWFWFVLSAALCFSIAFIYLRYEIPAYQSIANIMLISEKDQSSPGAVFNDISMFSQNADAQVEDEILVLKSRGVIESVVKKLHLNLQYFVEGTVLTTELYNNAPIAINFIASDSIINATNFNFHIDITSDVGFDYRINKDDNPKHFTFGETIPTAFGGMIITPKTESKKNLSGTNLNIQMTSVNYMTESLRNNIFVYQSGKSSKVLTISLVDPLPNKAIDIINTLIMEYDSYSSKVKNIRAKNTAEFIDSRVELIASDLVNVDDSIVRFKTGNKITDVSSEAGQFLSSSAQNEQSLDELRTQMRILDYMNESLNSSAGFEPIPANLGIGDPAISALAARYSELLSNRERLLRSAGEKNLVVVELDQSLNSIRQSLRQNINNATKSLNIRMGSLETQSDRINSKIFSVPGQERRLRSIERKQGIKESLYLYLLQKREEAAITLTATSPNLKIVDTAYTFGAPVSPNSRMIYIGALFIGLFLPFSIIYVGDLLDTKIHNKEDLDQIIKDMPVLGELPRLKGKELNSLVARNDRSLLSESFRIIRTNFDFVRRGRHVQAYDNVIFITSTINGEGKSFFSINMALTLANTDKRVLLIGADIRNPQTYLGLANQKKKQISKTGLTEYLTDNSIAVDEAIETYTISDNKIDVLLSGKVPPNPAELLMSERMKPLFDHVSNKYDYVIVDTAPSMLVTDTLLISQYAGHTVYVTRADYTEKSLLNFAKDLHDKNKLNGMMLVVNDVNQANFGYGARYGYYGAKKKSFFNPFSKS
ncbi:polysaccharide biosynthesis tyrosine autokinase [Gaetbulibacter aquiaggeris]|uniref:non-specific protein-tyrosine kinase n=1 Tax=Gaetbulibacter aquiaggeris TaxID=1735373 RepID=A0ABW7MS93_9FLAO